jgi:hypothetical protein
MYTLNRTISFVFVSILLFTGCKKNYELDDLVTPSNVTLSYEIVGADSQNPYGDGSGYVDFSASASNAITFTYDFGDGKDKQVAPDGNTQHLFSVNGVNIYTVTVYAVGTGGITSSQSIQVEVLSNFLDDEAVQILSGGSSRSWYWAADKTGHLGLGPNDMIYPDGEHTWPYWYQAAPWEKSGTSLYECELVFTYENDKLTFEQLNPTGEAFIQGLYSESLGLGPEGSYPWDIEGEKLVSLAPSNSIATVDGGYRGTSMIFSDGGFMGFYAGTSEYEIMDINEQYLTVRMVQANEKSYAWYHIFTTIKPEQ